jgi:predicted permease
VQSTLLAVFCIYFFILLGFLAKKIFKEQIDQKTLILISIYFLQPILTFWGLTRKPIDFNLIITPFVYFITISFVLVILLFISKYLFNDSKDRSIFVASSLIGNTGNLGIPLGIALFGDSSVPYTSIINIANIFFIYTVGVYLFAKSSFSLKKSLLQIVKIPILWFAIIAIIFNYSQIKIDPQLDNTLQMGAYATIVIQLMIFGIYLSNTAIKTINFKLSLLISFVKLLFIPIAGMIVLSFFSVDTVVGQIFMLSLIVPLAVNNVNIAALYNCKPYDVTASVLISTILFLFILYFDLKIFLNLI